MKVRVWATPEAQAQTQEVGAWWRVNRPAASSLFAEEFDAAVGLLGDFPDIGRRYSHPTVAGVVDCYFTDRAIAFTTFMTKERSKSSFSRCGVSCAVARPDSHCR